MMATEESEIYVLRFLSVGMGSGGRAGSGPVHSPLQVIRLGSGLVLVHQSLDDIARVVHLVQAVLEHGLLAELVQESFAFPQLVELDQRTRKQLQNQFMDKSIS
jgi:hypothetical protein